MNLRRKVGPSVRRPGGWNHQNIAGKQIISSTREGLSFFVLCLRLEPESLDRGRGASAIAR